MVDQIKLVVGARLMLCTRIVQGKRTFLRADKDLGDARYMGLDYSRESQALYSAFMRARPKDFCRCATSFVQPLIVE